MNEFWQSLSNREKSLVIWITLFVAWIFINSGTRSSALAVLKSLFLTQIGAILLGVIAYMTLVIYLAYTASLWKASLLKDTLFWFFGAALVLFFDINKARTVSYFRLAIVDLFKWGIFTEFILNLYTFGLEVELILLPVGVLLFLVKVYAGMRGEDQAKKAANVLLNFIGSIMIFYVLYKSIVQYEEIFRVDHVYEILLPIFLTIALIPVLYALALYMVYETLFIRVAYLGRDAKHQTEIKVAVLRIAGLNLNRLDEISKKISYDRIHANDSAINAIKSLVS
ncbi:MAG: hypothetical protein EOO15_04485 [Chitinophagaceae bacterium]|nr:MAG: hypothetical protein EOO15_04485 [Chitinophagaceae bacterium]